MMKTTGGKSSMASTPDDSSANLRAPEYGVLDESREVKEDIIEGTSRGTPNHDMQEAKSDGVVQESPPMPSTDRVSQIAQMMHQHALVSNPSLLLNSPSLMQRNTLKLLLVSKKLKLYFKFKLITIGT